MAAITNVYDLEKAVNAYMERHGMKPKWTSLNHEKQFYNVNYTMDYDRLESRIITMKNGKTRVIFKVNGKIESLYK